MASSRINKIKKTVEPILTKYGVKRAALFGSCVAGRMKKGSDVDLLVELSEDISLLDFVGIRLEIKDALGKDVDLVEYNAIKPALKKYILRDQVRII